MDRTTGGRQVRVMFLVVSASMGGAESHALALAQGLDPRHFDVSLVYLKDEAESPQAHARVQEGVFVFCLGADRKLDLAAVRQLNAYANAKEIDIIVCVNPYPLVYAWMLRLTSKRRVRIVEILHAAAPSPIETWLQVLTLRPLFWMSDFLVYMGKNQRSYWERHLLTARRTEVVRHGVNVNRVRDDFPVAAKCRFREAHGFADSDYIVGVCGALRHDCGHAELVAAIHTARAAGTAVKCLIIGDGPHRRALESMVDRLGLQGEVKLTGALRDGRLAVSCCDVMAVPSRREAVSLAALESMALGKPLIVANVGNASEFVEHDKNGLLYAQADVAQLARHIQHLSDRRRRAAFGVACLARVHSQFSLAHMVDAYHRIFLDLHPRQG